MSFQCSLLCVNCLFFLPNTQVQDLKALLQKNHSPFEDEMCGEEELRMTFYKNLKFNKDKERKWVNTTCQPAWVVPP